MSSAVLYTAILGMLIVTISNANYGNLGRLHTLAWAIVGLLLKTL